jgi:hypothetical protein
MVNLILAPVWLLIAVVLFLWPTLNPEARAPSPLLAWLAALLSGYSLLRWWLSVRLARRRSAVSPARPRPRANVRTRARTLPEPDPTFDFREGPPPRPSGTPPDDSR